MKLYGSNRRDMITCRYGCCGISSLAVCPQSIRAKADKKKLRKRARQQAKKESLGL